MLNFELQKYLWGSAVYSDPYIYIFYKLYICFPFYVEMKFWYDSDFMVVLFA